MQPIMGTFVAGQNSVYLIGGASIITEGRELAWAERSVSFDPARSWVLGKYVEADRANNNKQYWSLEDLQESQHTISNAPLNLVHRARSIVGHFVDTEMMFPISEHADDAPEHPHIEALATFYKYYFPDEHKIIQASFDMGALALSMECVSQSITCHGPFGCGETFEYAGSKSDRYCAHLNNNESYKKLNKPHFLAGALIYPPNKPGWSDATVHDLSRFVEDHIDEADGLYGAFKANHAHLQPKDWEAMMLKVLSAAAAKVD